MKLYKPMVKISSKAMTIILAVVGLAMIALGAYFSFFQAQGYVKTTAVIVELGDEDITEEGEPQYKAIAKYTVDGKEYVSELDAYVTAKDLGKEIKIKYDPANPEKALEDSLGLKLYLLIAGAVLVLIACYSLIRNKKQIKSLEDLPDVSLFGARQTGEKTRKLYFMTDLGTAKGTCRIEDENKNVLYEAVSKRFSLIADSEMEFVDRTLNRRATHFIGKTTTTSSSSIFVIDDHSTFTVDGKDVWKLLHDSGIKISTGLDGLKWTYGISRDGVEIARAAGCGVKAHEEDEKGVVSKIPARGFYRIETKEENLDALFLTLFAISRTDMMIYE